MKKHFIILSIIICGIFPVFAQISDSTEIYFRQGHSYLELNRGNNAQALQKIIDSINYHTSDSSHLNICKIRIEGGASPEGNLSINRRLSVNRANRIFDYVKSHSTLPDSITDYKFIGRDWNLLLSLSEADPDLPDYDTVIQFLRGITAKIESGEEDTEQNLLDFKKLSAGKPYRYLYSKVFPLLRASRLIIEYDPRLPKFLVPNMPLTLTGITATPPEEIAITQIPLMREGDNICRPFYMDLRSNMLYDLLALPNIGAEFYVGKNFSVIANWMYGWWSNNSRHRYWRAYGGDIGGRWWFGKASHRKPLTGHHIGLYAGIITYDFEFGGTGYMGGLPHHTLWDRCNYIAGIEYGYSLPIAARLNIDFTVGIGYIGGKVIKYKPQNGEYMWQSTHQLNWFGPTKAEISLVWLIGCDNFNRKKGGSR